MAFPQVAGSSTSENATNTTSSSITLPASVAAGDLLVAFIAADAGATAFTWPGSWAELLDAGHTGFVMSAAWLKATGGETSVSVTHTSERSVHGAYRITGWHGTTAPEVTAGVTGNSTTPDPGSLNPTNWDVEDTLWIAFFGADDSAAPFPVTAWPYANNQISKAGTGTPTPSAAVFAACTTESAAASVDPGTFTLTNSETWRAYTMAVRPAGAAPSTQIDDPIMRGVIVRKR